MRISSTKSDFSAGTKALPVRILPGVWPIQEQLRLEICETYVTKTRRLISAQLRKGPPEVSEELCWPIAYLIVDTMEAGGAERLICRIADIVETRELHANLAPDAIQELANGLGNVRFRLEGQDTPTLEWIDQLVDQLTGCSRQGRA